MGAMISFILSWITGSRSRVDALGDEADVPDPTSGLTPRDVAYIRTTWDLVRPNMKQHGMNFFLLFFETHPIVQTRFGPFNGVPLEELRSSKRLAAHGATVMGAIDSYIVNLDDIECVVEMLQTTGANHIARGVEKSDFDLLPPVMIKYLSESLGSAWSPEAEKSWYKLLEVVNKVICSAYN